MSTLRVMTGNLLIDQVDTSHLRSVLEEVRPDIVCVQELRPEAAEAIAATHPNGLLDARMDYDGMGIASARPIDVSELPMPGRRGLVGRLDPSSWPEVGSPMEVVNAHLLNPLIGGWRHTQATRRGQIAAIRDHVESTGLPTVIVGDMNASPRWPEYRLLSEFARDAALEAGTATPTWAQFRPGRRWLRIDHVFVRGVEPVATHAKRIRGSDHFAVVADLEIPPVTNGR